MAKKGWWHQLINDEYPETQLSYGQDITAVHGDRGKRPIPNSIERVSLTKECSICGTEHWIDKTCQKCSSISKQQQNLYDIHTQMYRVKKKISVHCPICGNIMKLRTARKGKYSGQKFWGCSTYPKCKGISQYTPSRYMH